MVITVLLFFLFIGCFLLGMMWVRQGLAALSEQKMKRWMENITNRPVNGFMIGTLVTAVLQSSSAVMVMTIGMVSAGILSFSQTIGIILGTNIGTTVTLELLALPITNLTYVLVGGSIVLKMSRRTWVSSLGTLLFGLGMIFAAMTGFEWTASLLFQQPFFSGLFKQMDHISIAFLVGIVFTSLIQSSTAMTGIAIGFLNAEAITLEGGISIMLGANIGTCVTAWLASIGGGREAKLTAYAHIWLNVIGGMAAIPFIEPLSVLCQILSDTSGTQLAHASVLYNLISSLIVLPFSIQFGQFIERIHK
ncbi:Na/Pi symporter [Aeribacillus pallidus]|uniref:Na/Pi symporter n=1 Tax=Aeribacillus pallidus TaxID=33936 RepID=UPI003D1CF780